MKKILMTSAVALGMSAISATPAAAHPETNIDPAGQCNTVSEAEYRQVRKGMTLLEVEHVLGCHGSHQQTNEFKTFTSDIYIFKKGSTHLISVGVRDGKIWRKRDHK